MAGIVQPKVLKGFRDFLPRTEISRKKLIRALEDHFTSCGYLPIDTPVLEYAEILLSKGGGETDKQMYRFTDHGKRDVALRFDLTVPFARYVAAHRNELAMPFRRYHIGKVWRGENTQKGRYREFLQCDFDVVGVDSAAADLEIMLIMLTGLQMTAAGEMRVHFSHRGLFNQFLDKLGLEGKTAEVLRLVDKTGKIGAKEVGNLLEGLVGKNVTDTLMDFITPEDDNRGTLEKMTSLASHREEPGVGEVRMKIILDAIEELQLQHKLILDPSITRGLDYYTGIVFETFLHGMPGLGSVCSGGRYGNLTGLFMKEAVSGVGASIGLDRLMAGFAESGRSDSSSLGIDILILMLSETLLARYQMFAQELRQDGLAAEVYPEAKKLSVQFRYAESKGIPLALIVGADEDEKGTVNLKDLRSRESFNSLSFEDAREKILELRG